MNKKEIRNNFRNSVFKRDKFCCAICGKPGKDRQGGDLHLKFHKKLIDLCELDAHHIISRKEIENQGYVRENGISVCSECHLKCEEYWNKNIVDPGFHPNELFTLIGSSEELARRSAQKLK